MFWNLLKKKLYQKEVIEAIINIIKEISFNEDTIMSLIFEPKHYGSYKDFLTIQSLGSVDQISKVENLFMSLQKKDMGLIKYFMKELVNEVRNYYGLELLQECCFLSPNLLDKSINKKIKLLKGGEKN